MSSATPKYASIDEYISAFPSDIRQVLHTLRAAIKETAPDATEAIKYGMPTFVLFGNLVYFAAWKRHIALYPITSEMEASLPSLKEYKTSGRGTVQFPYGRALPLDLIRQIVLARVEENTANAQGRNEPDDGSEG